MSLSQSAEFLEQVKKSFSRDYDRDLPPALVVSSDQAAWLDQAKLTTPARIGPLTALPARSFEILLQEIGAHGATDLQRHAHEAVHYVQAGTGYSEIGQGRFDWRPGDFIYTPPWAIHRHYNTGEEVARLIVIENSRLLEALGLHERETFGLLSWAEHQNRAR